MKDNCPIFCDGHSRTEKWQRGQNESRHHIFEQESAFTGFGLAPRHCYRIESLRSTVRTPKVVFVLGILRGGWFAWTSAVYTVTHAQFTPTPTFPIFLLPSAEMHSCSGVVVLVRKLSQLTPLSWAKRTNLRYFILLCEITQISCDLAGWYTRLPWTLSPR